MSLQPLDSTVSLLPNDTEAEDDTLAVILHNGVEHLRALARIGLEPDAFYGSGRRVIYEAALTLAEHGEPFDVAAVRTHLKATGKTTKQTEAVLVAIASGEIAAGTTTRHAERVVAQAQKRRHIHALNDALSRVLAGEAFDPAWIAEATTATVGFRPVPLDPTAGEYEETGYLLEPYLPRAARVWAVGEAASSKSMWALWIGASLTREGYRVVYLSQENPEAEDRRRLERLRPDWSRLAFYNNAGFDLANAEHRTALRAACDGADLLVVDTLTACWSGDENDNAAIAAFDRDALAPITREGCAALVIHHTGHPGAFGARKGVGAARGASSIGQKADALLHFEAEGDAGGFRITHSKNRLGGYKAPLAFFRVADLEDGGLTIATEARSLTAYAEGDADTAVALIRSQGRVEGKKALLRALTYDAGLSHGRASAAVARLDTEEPRRVIHRREAVETTGGVQQVEVYTLVEPVLPV